MEYVEIVNLTEDRLAKALAVFKIGGWDEESLFYVKAEMNAFLQGDIQGYVRARFVVAIANDDIIGVAAWAPSMCAFSVYELSWATVLPKWRHRGINNLMLQERIKQIRLHYGAEPFTVIVYTWDNPMYDRAGFLPVTTSAERFKANNAKQLLMAQFRTDATLGD